MFDNRILKIAIPCICLGLILASLLQVKRVVEPVTGMEIFWDKRFPADSILLPGIPEGIVRIGLFGTAFENSLVEYKDFLVTDEKAVIHRTNLSEQITNQKPLEITIVEKLNQSDTLLGNIISTSWVSWQQDNIAVDYNIHPPSYVNTSLLWSLNPNVSTLGFHQISYSLPTVENWSNFEALVLWIRGDYDPSLFSIGIGSQNGLVGWYTAADHIARTIDEWEMFVVELAFPNQGNFNSSITTSIWAQYYVNDTRQISIHLSEFYLSDIFLSDIVAGEWDSQQMDTLSIDFNYHPFESYSNQSLMWEIDHSSGIPAYHNISCQLPTIEDWSKFDVLVTWVSGDYDLDLLSIGIRSQDGRIGWYNSGKHIAKTVQEWRMLAFLLEAPDESDFDSSSVASIWARYDVQSLSSLSTSLWLSNFCLFNSLLGSVISTDWVCWQQDVVSVDLVTYPPETDINKSLIWDLSYSSHNPGFHQISHQLTEPEDWSDFEAMLLWCKTDNNLSRLSIGLGSHEGTVGWYAASEHMVKSLQEWVALLLPLDTPDRGNFNTSLVTSILGEYYIDETQATMIWLANFHFARTELGLKELNLRHETLFELPLLTSQVEGQVATKLSRIGFDIIPSREIRVTEDSFAILAAKVTGYADSVRIELEGLNINGDKESLQAIEIIQSGSFILKIIRLKSMIGLREVETVNRISVTYIWNPGTHVNITAQFLMLNIVEGEPKIDDLALDSSVGGTLAIGDVEFPHRFSWTGLQPTQIYIVSTIHELQNARGTTLYWTNSTWWKYYSGVSDASRIVVNTWFSRVNEAPIVSATLTSLGNSTEALDLNYTKDYEPTTMPLNSEGVKISVIYAHWQSPWVEITLVSCAVLLAEAAFLFYKRIKPSSVNQNSQTKEDEMQVSDSGS